MVSGISRNAPPAHTPDATVPSRSARYPPASSTPDFCGGTRKAATRNDPTARTAAISPAARTHGRPSVVAAPGVGNPVAVSASASDNAPIPAAVQPASPATPVSSGHTSSRVLAADCPTVMCPGYGRAPAEPALPSLASGALLARLEFAGDELIARDLLDVAAIPQNRPQFPPEGVPAVRQVRARGDQILVGNNLTRGGKEQRGHRLAATNPGLCHVLPANPER